jgi:hypothetical protein
MMNPRRWVPMLRSRLGGTLRVGAYVFVASLGCAAVGARVVYADFGEATLQVGSELAGLNDVIGSTNTIAINGAVMNVASAFTDQSTTQVLDRFEAMCRSHPEMFTRALEEVPQSWQDSAHVSHEAARHLGIVRKERGPHGALTCFTDDRPASIGDVAVRLQSFVKTHDLAELGHFRYVYADKTPTGKTHVTTVWTDGPMRVGEMFPARGDAPGTDSHLVPRPPSSRRMLSGAAYGMPFGVRLYESRASVPEIREFYAKELEPNGWRLVTDQPEHHVLAYMANGGVTLYLTLQPRAHGGEGTLVTITETQRAPLPSASSGNAGEGASLSPERATSVTVK